MGYRLVTTGIDRDEDVGFSALRDYVIHKRLAGSGSPLPGSPVEVRRMALTASHARVAPPKDLRVYMSVHECSKVRAWGGRDVSRGEAAR